MSAETGADRWQVAQSLTKTIGAAALNIANLADEDHAVLSLRSSMSQQWLEEYIAESYITVDPLVLQAAHAPRQQVLTSEGMLACDRSETVERAYGAGLAAYGYDRLLTFKFADGNNPHTKLVVFAGDLSEHDFHRAHNERELQQVAALIAAFVDEPQEVEPHLARLIARQPLSDRERDVLSLLATGFRNDEIAYRLGIAEVTVRAHVVAARKKLGAKTREQALVEAIRTKQIAP
nr:helix-turn-helix transcriptional regulator [Thalassobius sp. Cn5-15]